MRSTDRDEALALLARLAATSVGHRLILGGSSGLFATSETIPPLTEDVDLLVDADWVASHETDVLEALAAVGLRHVPGTCTFVSPSGPSVDLVGYSLLDRDDRIGGGSRLQVMVYGDLSTLIAPGGATFDVASGGQALTAAALAAVKLLTVRVEKGSKDKLQALLLIAENAGDEALLADLRGLLARFVRDRQDDALSDAQAAFLALSADPHRTDPQSRGYAGMRSAAEEGLRLLQRALGAE